MTKKLIKTAILSILFISLINKGFAQDAFIPFQTINPAMSNPTSSEVEVNLNLNQNASDIKKINLTKTDPLYYLVSATDRFVQCNIRASWDDFKKLINDSKDSDFLYITYANKMSDLGLFDLANLASSKTRDKDISNLSLEAMKRYYYPRRKLKLEDELFLAEVYSDILYNNRSSEATNELLKRENLLTNSDYANYMVALGSYKSSLFKRAAKYINIAVIQNPSNLNYQALKAKIQAENQETAEAIKTVENLKKQNLYSYEYERKVKSLEQFILYKTKKRQWEKDYHLGYYYFYENDPSKAIRTLQSALESKKKANTEIIYALMSEIYLSMNEFEKASDTAKKACRFNRCNPKALLTLGDLSYRNENYKQALDYYKKAASQDKKSYLPFIKEAQAYQKLANIKKAEEIYEKILKTHSDSWEAYYNIALLEKNKEEIYLKKALAVNIFYKDAWIDLARVSIDRGNYNTAQTYLANAYYIDENDFRYYYYQGLVSKNLGDMPQAEYNFKKCLKLKSNHKEAQTELDSILFKQDNI